MGKSGGQAPRSEPVLLAGAPKPAGFGWSKGFFDKYLPQTMGQPYPTYQGQIDPGLSPTMQNVMRMSQQYSQSPMSPLLGQAGGGLGGMMGGGAMPSGGAGYESLLRFSNPFGSGGTKTLGNPWGPAPNYGFPGQDRLGPGLGPSPPGWSPTGQPPGPGSALMDPGAMGVLRGQMGMDAPSGGQVPPGGGLGMTYGQQGGGVRSVFGNTDMGRGVGGKADDVPGATPGGQSPRQPMDDIPNIDSGPHPGVPGDPIPQPTRPPFGGGGGGGNNINYPSFQPSPALSFQPTFVGWDPSNPNPWMTGPSNASLGGPAWAASLGTPKPGGGVGPGPKSMFQPTPQPPPGGGMPPPPPPGGGVGTQPQGPPMPIPPPGGGGMPPPGGGVGTQPQGQPMPFPSAASTGSFGPGVQNFGDGTGVGAPPSFGGGPGGSPFGPTGAFDVFRASVPAMNEAIDRSVSRGVAALAPGNRYGSAAFRAGSEAGKEGGLELTKNLSEHLFQATQGAEERGLRGALGAGQLESAGLDRMLQAMGMAPGFAQTEDELMRNRITLPFQMGGWEQGRQDQFGQQGYQDFENNKLGWFPHLAGLAGSGNSAPGSPTYGQQQFGGQQSGMQQFMSTWGPLITAGIMAASDRDLKTDIKPIDEALDRVRRMKARSYRWKLGRGRDYGVVAQELREVAPELVVEGGPYLKVNYGGLIGMLLAAVQELADKVDRLESEHSGNVHGEVAA